MTQIQFESFATWAQLLDHIAAGYRLFYQAPLDYRPAQVSAVVRCDGQIRVTPVYSDCDPFTAGTAHLERFRRVNSKVS
jgi:hypothetical protein